MNNAKIAKIRSIAVKVSVVLLITLLAIVLLIPKPSEVKGLTVTKSTYNSASIAWKESANAKAYHVYRSENGSDYEFVDTVEENKFDDKDLRTGTEYSYKIRAVNGIKKTSVDNAVSAEVSPELEKPTLKIKTNKGKIEIKIDEVEGATGYEIYRDNEKLVAQEGTSYVDKEADADEAHTYKVRAERVMPAEEGIEEDPGEEDPVDVTSADEESGEAAEEDSLAAEQTDTETAYSEFSKTKKAKLVSAGDIDAEIVADNIQVTWEGSETYTSYKLYNGDDLIAETQDNEYLITGFDPDKEYDFRLIGYSDEKKSPTTEKKYVVTEEPLTNEEAIDKACEWAVMIAEDDSFTYGEVPRALHYGCYFCNTNGKKGAGYEKTYICNALVTAAFAHGAGDEAMLNLCRSGSGVAMNEASYTRYGRGNWTNAGKPDISGLNKGDVLVASKNIGSSDFHHVALYIGDGYLVEAVRKGFSAESIRVHALSSDYYSKFDFVMRYTGNGGGSKYALKEK